MIACAPHAKLGSLCESAGWLEVELLSVEIEKPEDLNLILGQAHFIKTVEDLYEALVGSSPDRKSVV